MTRGNFDKPDRLGASNGRLPIKIAVLQGCVQLLSLQDDSGGNRVASQLTGQPLQLPRDGLMRLVSL